LVLKRSFKLFKASLKCLDKSGIKVAEYMTELPERKLLEQKLHKTVALARKRLEAKPT